MQEIQTDQQSAREAQENPAEQERSPGSPGEGRPEVGRNKLVDVRESVRYRRRAQDAERRCTSLEAELAELRQAQGERSKSLGEELAAERLKAAELQGRLQALDTDRHLERELIRAGARDAETALLVARQRLAAGGTESLDLAELARRVLEEKPYLKSAERSDLPPLGKASQGAKPSAPREQARLHKLASAARAAGKGRDLAHYMRERRSRGGAG